MKNLATLALCAYVSTAAMAQIAVNDTISADSLQCEELHEIVVESRDQRLGVEVSTYIPTSKQKNAANSATDLLSRMAIPQLSISVSGEVTSLAGKSIDIFINFLPASSGDLQGMKTTDVKRVEYYDFPSDPRFQGKAHVVNFIMQQYEYGGYVKPYFNKCFGAGSSQFALFNRLQYKRMTYDVASNFLPVDRTHQGYEQWETFRLPQTDGTKSVFERYTSMGDTRFKSRQYYASFRALYSKDNLQIRNSINMDVTNRPIDSQAGTVTYTPDIVPPDRYILKADSRVKSVNYNGYLYWTINDNNSINFVPKYSYSHTSTNSIYEECSAGVFANGAMDNSHSLSGLLTYSHKFGDAGKLNCIFKSGSNWHHTSYTGSAENTDKSYLLNYVHGVQYSLSRGKFYGLVGAGYCWEKTKYGDKVIVGESPFVDVMFQYSPTDRQSLDLEYHHSFSHPSSSYLSETVIRRDPLMSYTGNPDLRPIHSNDLTISYSFIPNNRFSLSTYFYLWAVNNAYYFDYTATPTGLLRTVRQPCGLYYSMMYGIKGNATLLDKKLQLAVNLMGTSWHSAAPSPHSQTCLYGYVRARYYLGNWNFGAMYYTRDISSDGFMSSTVVETRPYSYLSVGWSNSKLNLELITTNFTQWDWRGQTTKMRSPNYDMFKRAYSQGEHCFVKLIAIYTFSFGKKVERGDDSIQQSSISTAILK